LHMVLYITNFFLKIQFKLEGHWSCCYVFILILDSWLMSCESLWILLIHEHWLSSCDWSLGCWFCKFSQLWCFFFSFFSFLKKIEKVPPFVFPSNFKFKTYSHNPSDFSLLVVGDASVKHNNNVTTSTCVTF